MKARDFGKRTEELAAAYLRRSGMELRDRNWHCAEGEVDIIARDGEEWVFVEVKGRRSNAFGPPEAAVGPVKQRHLREAAWRYLMAHDLEEAAWRIDVIAVVMSPSGRVKRFEHYRNAVSGDVDSCP